jgi:hypothetical protein
MTDKAFWNDRLRECVDRREEAEKSLKYWQREHRTALEAVEEFERRESPVSEPEL